MFRGEYALKKKENRVSYNDIKTFKKSDKLDAIKKDPNSDYNSFISSNPDSPNPSSSNIHTEN